MLNRTLDSDHAGLPHSRRDDLDVVVLHHQSRPVELVGKHELAQVRTSLLGHTD